MAYRPTARRSTARFPAARARGRLNCGHPPSPLGRIPPIVAATDGIPQPAERLHDRNPYLGEISCASPLDSHMLGMTSRCDPRTAKSTDPETRARLLWRNGSRSSVLLLNQILLARSAALKCLRSIEQALHSRPSTEGRTAPTFGAEHSRGREPRRATVKRPASWSLTASRCATHRER